MTTAATIQSQEVSAHLLWVFPAKELLFNRGLRGPLQSSLLMKQNPTWTQHQLSVVLGVSPSNTTACAP